ncbi:MAG: hypothetical protein A4E60_01710 [Syntrophorhabdus sp. PtaB.Bin047]|nr:MAG: hypothetical protein A4E60_01710 [Syntrophorhabdus sp. PtaB.Bin047]
MRGRRDDMTIKRRARVLRRTRCLCAWCGRERKGNGAWVRSGLNTKEMPLALVTHGICPDCARRLLAGGIRDKMAKRAD